MAGRFSNPVALIENASGENPVMPPAKFAIFQVETLALGLKPLALVVLAAMLNLLVSLAPIVRLPLELMRSQPVPAEPFALASYQA
jgi:hypothetical protein